jgi:hypothetical protein
MGFDMIEQATVTDAPVGSQAGKAWFPLRIQTSVQNLAFAIQCLAEAQGSAMRRCPEDMQTSIFAAIKWAEKAMEKTDYEA